jgi:hypothetical protein
MTGCQVIYRGQLHEFMNLETAQEFIDNLPSPKGELEIIGAPKLFQLLNEVGAPVCNWREINQEICREWSTLFTAKITNSDWYRTELHRISLLQTFQAVMDIAESTILPEDVEVFRNAREQQYKTFIYQESMVGENVCVETLYAVTQREIDAGRMSIEHSCRKLAEEATAAPHLTRAELLQEKLGEPLQTVPYENPVKKLLKWFTNK